MRLTYGLAIHELVAYQFVAFEVDERAAQVAVAVFAAGIDAGGAPDFADGARFVDVAVQRYEGLVAFDGGAHRLAAYRPGGDFASCHDRFEVVGEEWGNIEAGGVGRHVDIEDGVFRGAQLACHRVDEGGKVFLWNVAGSVPGRGIGET